MSHYSEIVPGWLWAGDMEAAVDEPRRLGVKRVISVTSRLLEKIALACKSDPDSTYINHHWLKADDDSLADPENINRALWQDSDVVWFAGLRPGHMPKLVPTFIHCQLGQNRSTAIAACWLAACGLCFAEVAASRLTPTLPDCAVNFMEYFRAPFAGYTEPIQPSPDAVLARVIINAVSAIRTPDLKAIGRSWAEVSPNMRSNVHNYITWLMRGCRPEWIAEGKLK